MDTKKTALFATFIISFLLLANNFLTQLGYEPLFFTAPKPVATAAVPPQKNIASPINNQAAAPAKTEQNGQIITIKTPLYQISLNTLGASIEKMQLNDYRENLKDTKNILVFNPNMHYSARQGLINGANHTHIFTPNANQSLELKSSDSSGVLNYVLSAEANGLKTTKTFKFYKDKYVIDTVLNIQNTSTQNIAPIVYNELLRDDSPSDHQSSFFAAPQTFVGPAIYTSEQKFNKIKVSDLKENKASFPNQSQSGWVAIVQHYFTSAWFDQSKENKQFYAEPLEKNTYRVGYKSTLSSLTPNQQTQYSASLFAGPQKEFLLEKTVEGLELVKDYGWAAIFAKPLFWLLDKIHSLVLNWGWAIILLTILLKTLFYPLTASSQRSMEKLKDLQPKMTELKERYSKEPQKMQQELVKLYRESGANPMGGCLPILIQAPVFFALYYVLISSVEIRHAPWLGWIQDLTAPDPFYILPALMALSMYVQIKLGPKPNDPTQAKVMMVIPLVFSVMFFLFPAGLVLYYVVNNILSILQMQYIKKGIEKSKTAGHKTKPKTVAN
jgi:YidC/Oxa1 family membrane protein insertase